MFRRILAALALVAALCLGLLYFRGVWNEARDGEPPAAGSASTPSSGSAPGAPKPGGTLTGTLRAVPPTLNRFTTASFPTYLATLLTHATLVHIDPATDEPQPWLAASIDRPTPTTIVIALRPDLRFSDGSPLTADDVVWSVKAAYATPGGGIGDALRINGAEIQVTPESPTRVVFTLPSPWTPAVRLLEALPIFPRAAIESALAAGTFANACPTTAPCPGAGPFVVERYEPGQRIVFARNPHYWRTAACEGEGCVGARLPYLDGLTLEIVPEQNAELLRLTSGQADMVQSELRAEDIRALKPDVDAGNLTLVDVGTGRDRQMLWFNLGPAPVDPARAFLRQDAFREAVSLAVDRKGFAETVFLGAADASPDPVPAANRTWTAADLPRPAYDPARAAALLEGLDLKDRDNDGLREDAAGRPVRFTVLVQSGITSARTGMEFVRGALANIGVGLDIVSLEVGAVMQQFGKGEYDAIFHQIQISDTDPASSLDFWLSRGGSHLWHPSQASPATGWEADIDARMLRLAGESDQAARVREFAEVQRLMLTHNPVLWFAAPRIYVATRPRVGGLKPRLARPQVLWNADELYVK